MEPRTAGTQWVQTDLAKTLRQIAKYGPDWFYQDGFAKACCDHLSRVGGILKREDFFSYHAKLREPISTKYRKYKVFGFPTPSSGGTHIAQMLAMLEQFPVRSLYESSPVQWYHLLAECMKRAFADRAYWLGDRDFVKVPDSLLDKDYAKELASSIALDRCSTIDSHGYPPGTDRSVIGASDDAVKATQTSSGDDSGKHTTHLTVADRLGNWVALTSTINTAWGSKLMIPGTGVMLNNQMDDFSIAPGTPNAFGLIGSAANAIAPKKRPLSSMSPTIVVDGMGESVLTAGAAGGPKIINATLQILVRCLDLEMHVEKAVAAPRIHHQWRPNTLQIEKRFGADSGYEDPSAELKKLGHEIKSVESIAAAHAIVRSRSLVAASEPRVSDSSAMSLD